MTQDSLKKLDSVFKAFSVVSEGNYVFLCDLKEDFSRWSESAVDYFKLPDIYMSNAGEIWESHIHPDDRQRYHDSIERIFCGDDSGHEMQYRALAADGHYVVCTCRGVIINGYDGKPEYFAGSIKNHGLLSYIDTITGMRSLYGFFDDIKSISWQKNESIAIMIGVTGFSNINDVYGYTFGNSVLRSFSNLIQDSFANVGSVYRLDGTKFCVITNSLTQSKVTEIYNDIRATVSEGLCIEDQHVSLSINAGIIIIDDFNITGEIIYSCLKYAYSESKNHRLGALKVFKNKLSRDNIHLIEKLNAIRLAVMDDCRGFYLCYQPIMFADTEKLKGMEALIRWRDDTYGIVPPIQFIPVLEQDALFPELGRWILRQAMNDCKVFLEKYPNFLININISYTQIEKNDFVEDVFRILDETGFPPTNLCLEITERCRLLDTTLLQNKLLKLKEKGIKIALDDFGTGFSSLGVLRELPIDVVKIDREFVKNIEKSVIDRNTVQFVSSLADAFSTEVCVEGVETAQMRDLLRNYKISSFQGYFYSKPITIDQLKNTDL